MAKVYLICGRICSGKSTYAAELCRQEGAVLLSTDEIMLAMFGQYVGDMHDTYVERTQNYLLEKTVELTQNGISVVLDWGFWQKEDRDAVRKFFRSRNVEFRFDCIRISEEVWHERLKKRNAAVLSGEASAYYVDDNLAAKFKAYFEMPEENEIDLWIT